MESPPAAGERCKQLPSIPHCLAGELVQVKCTAGTKALKEGVKSLHQVGSIIHSCFGILGSLGSPPPKKKYLQNTSNFQPWLLESGALVSFHGALHPPPSLSPTPHGSHAPIQETQRGKKTNVPSRLAALSASVKQDESSLMQETSEGQRRKTIRGYCYPTRSLLTAKS